MHPLLSSNTEECILGTSSDLGMTTSSSFNNSTSGKVSLSDCDNAIYSLYVVDSAISLCNFEHHIIGQSAYFIKYPVLDITDEDSSLQILFQSPANEAST